VSGMRNANLELQLSTVRSNSNSASDTTAAVFAYLEGPLRSPGPIETWWAMMVSEAL